MSTRGHKCRRGAISGAEGPSAGERLIACAARTDDWLRVTKQRLAPSKTWSFATRPSLRKFLTQRLHMGGARIKNKLSGRILGAHISVSQRRMGGCHLQRLTKGKRRFERIARLPHGGGPLRRMAEVAGVTCAVYGAETTPLPLRQLQALDAAALRA